MRTRALAGQWPLGSRPEAGQWPARGLATCAWNFITNGSSLRRSSRNRRIAQNKSLSAKTKAERRELRANCMGRQVIDTESVADHLPEFIDLIGSKDARFIQ